MGQLQAGYRLMYIDHW